jgi:hypothetical protein
MGQTRAVTRAQVLALPGPTWIEEDEVSWTKKDVEMTTPEELEAQDSQPVSIPIPTSSTRKRARRSNGRFCSGGRSDAIVTRGAPLPSRATPPSQLPQHSQNPFGPSTSAGPVVPRRIPVRVTSIFDPAMVIPVFEMYSHSTTPLLIYQYTAM